ncbi:MAG: MFS transporter [Cyanobacteria bacterium P01_F01_bin.150]
MAESTIFRARVNVVILSLCQALASTSITAIVTISALVGYSLASQKAFATLPMTVMQLATMMATIPASLFMKRWGRQKGFITGSCLAILGAGIGIQAILAGQFGLFCLASFWIGIFNSFAWYYRFAAADMAHDSWKAQAISLVVSGGVVAAIAGPRIANWTKDWFQPDLFAGALVVIVMLQCVILLLLQYVQIPPLEIKARETKERSLTTLAQQPNFSIAILGSAIGYGIMVLVMTATPLEMNALDYPFETTASVIQWHVLGMFAPSFITGILIARLGVLTIILSGVVLNLLCCAINLSGTSISHFSIALLLLGVGWNFMFVGSTTLFTEAYAPAEKEKSQAAHDFCMFACVVICSLLSGQLLYHFNWQIINQVSLVPIAIALFGFLWLVIQRD